jgi:hypothetical protein
MKREQQLQTGNIVKQGKVVLCRIDIVEKSDGKTIQLRLRQKAVEAVLNGAKLVEVSE